MLFRFNKSVMRFGGASGGDGTVWRTTPPRGLQCVRLPRPPPFSGGHRTCVCVSVGHVLLPKTFRKNAHRAQPYTHAHTHTHTGRFRVRRTHSQAGCSFPTAPRAHATGTTTHHAAEAHTRTHRTQRVSGFLYTPADTSAPKRRCENKPQTGGMGGSNTGHSSRHWSKVCTVIV